MLFNTVAPILVSLNPFSGFSNPLNSIIFAFGLIVMLGSAFAAATAKSGKENCNGEFPSFLKVICESTVVPASRVSETSVGSKIAIGGSTPIPLTITSPN